MTLLQLLEFTKANILEWILELEDFINPDDDEQIKSLKDDVEIISDLIYSQLDISQEKTYLK